MRGDIQCRIYLVFGKQPTSSKSGPFSCSLWTSSRRLVPGTWSVSQLCFFHCEWNSVMFQQCDSNRGPQTSLTLHQNLHFNTTSRGSCACEKDSSSDLKSTSFCKHLAQRGCVGDYQFSKGSQRLSAPRALGIHVLTDALTAGCDIWNWSLPMKDGGKRAPECLDSPWLCVSWQSAAGRVPAFFWIC